MHLAGSSTELHADCTIDEDAEPAVDTASAIFLVLRAATMQPCHLWLCVHLPPRSLLGVDLDLLDLTHDETASLLLAGLDSNSAQARRVQQCQLLELTMDG